MELYKLADNQISSQVADENIILNHQAGTYYSLNEVGSYVWKILQESPANFETLKEEILTNFEVDEQTCEKDLKALLNQLLNEKLVETI